MKVLDIALKDLLRYFRTAFLLVMMFVVPLLITGLIYFAFGSFGQEEKSFNLTQTHVWVVNLDQPEPQSGFFAGKILADFLQDKGLTEMIKVKTAPDESSARAAVNKREADVAVIIPSDFTVAVERPDSKASVILYHDPTKNIGISIVRSVVNEFIDGFNGAKIAVGVANQQLRAQGLTLDPATSESIAKRYAVWVQSLGSGRGSEATQSVVTIQPPKTEIPVANPFTIFLGPVMAGMMIFFVFFTGAATAQSIIYEDEEGTLARLFTTPTSQAAILGGKFFAVLATLVVQVLVLVFASALLFHIRWGEPLAVAVVTAGLVIAASGFGVFLMSFIKSTRQAGAAIGILMSITGILGGLIPLGDPSQPSPIEPFNLALPQGWAIRSWKLALSGVGPDKVLFSTALLVGMGAVFFIIGMVVFRKRFQ